LATARIAPDRPDMSRAEIGRAVAVFGAGLTQGALFQRSDIYSVRAKILIAT
jgi:hypothetical protein